MPTQLCNEIKSLEKLFRVQLRLNKLPILMVKSQSHLWILALIRKLCMRSRSLRADWKCECLVIQKTSVHVHEQ